MMHGELDQNTLEKYQNLQKSYKQINGNKATESEEVNFKLQAAQLIYSLWNDFDWVRNFLNDNKINLLEEAHNKASQNIVYKVLKDKDDYIMSFDKGETSDKEDSEGYSIIKIEDFEKKIAYEKKNEKDYWKFLEKNHIEVLHYLHKLNKKNLLSLENLKETFWEKNIIYILLRYQDTSNIDKGIKKILWYSNFENKIQDLISNYSEGKDIHKLSEYEIWNHLDHLSIWEAKEALSLSNLMYKTSNDKKQTRVFQWKLIEKILWSDKWYNSEYLWWYDSSKWWNILLKIDDFEKKAKSWEKLKARQTATYLLYLEETYSNVYQYKKKLREVFGKNTYKERLEKILDEWENKHITRIKDHLQEKNIISGNKFISFFSNLFNSFKDFFEWFHSLEPDAQEDAIEEMKYDLKQKKWEIYKEIKKSIEGTQLTNSQWEKLIEKIINALVDTQTNEEIYTTIIRYKKHPYYLKLDIGSLVNKTNEFKKIQWRKNYAEAVKSWKKQEAEKEKEKLNILEIDIKINHSLTKENWSELEEKLLKWESFEDIMKELRKKNKALDDAYKEKEEKEKKDQTNNKQENIEESSIKKEEVAKKTSTWNYFLPEINSEITPAEYLMQKDPEAKENLIRFHNFFKEINMLWVWKYRKDLVAAMGDRSINLEDNSLSEDEIVRFWNNLIKVINNLPNSKWEKNDTLHKQTNIGWVKNELKQYSEADSEINDEKTFNNLWEDKFTTQLRNTGIIDENLWFKREKFSNYLS